MPDRSELRGTTKVTDLCACGHQIIAHSAVDGCTLCDCDERYRAPETPREREVEGGCGCGCDPLGTDDLMCPRPDGSLLCERPRERYVTAAGNLRRGDRFFGVESARRLDTPLIVQDVGRNVSGRVRVDFGAGDVRTYEPGRGVVVTDA